MFYSFRITILLPAITHFLRSLLYVYFLRVISEISLLVLRGNIILTFSLSLRFGGLEALKEILGPPYNWILSPFLKDHYFRQLDKSNFIFSSGYIDLSATVGNENNRQFREKEADPDSCHLEQLSAANGADSSNCYQLKTDWVIMGCMQM